MSRNEIPCGSRATVWPSLIYYITLKLNEIKILYDARKLNLIKTRTKIILT